MRRLLRFALFGLVMAATQAASASEDVIGKRTQISFTEKFRDPYPTATVSAILDEKSDTLASLELRLGGKPIGIPHKAFADLRNPHLRSISVVCNPDISDPRWSVWIKIEFGEPIPSTEPKERFQFSSVAIMVTHGVPVSANTPPDSSHGESS
jgi:hypothetical protein